MDLALFDFDNTITRQDMFTAFIRYATPTRRRTLFSLLLMPVILGYKSNLISASVCRRIVVYCGFRGMRREEAQLLGKHFCDDKIADQIRPRAIDKLGWHKARGDKIIVVSASLDLYLRHWCEKQGVELLCSELADNQNVLNGKYKGKDCTGSEKARRIRCHLDLQDFDTIYAYGDSEEDLAMLELAQIKFFNWQPV